MENRKQQDKKHDARTESKSTPKIIRKINKDLKKKTLQLPSM